MSAVPEEKLSGVVSFRGVVAWKYDTHVYLGEPAALNEPALIKLTRNGDRKARHTSSCVSVPVRSCAVDDRRAAVGSSSGLGRDRVRSCCAGGGVAAGGAGWGERRVRHHRSRAQFSDPTQSVIRRRGARGVLTYCEMPTR